MGLAQRWLSLLAGTLSRHLLPAVVGWLAQKVWCPPRPIRVFVVPLWCSSCKALAFAVPVPEPVLWKVAGHLLGEFTASLLGSTSRRARPGGRWCRRDLSFWVGSCSVSLPSTSASLSPAVGASVSSWSPWKVACKLAGCPPGWYPSAPQSLLPGSS